MHERKEGRKDKEMKKRKERRNKTRWEQSDGVTAPERQSVPGRHAVQVALTTAPYALTEQSDTPLAARHLAEFFGLKNL